MSIKSFFKFHFFTLKIFPALFLLLSLQTNAQLRISRIYTDWNGYWTSNDKTAANNRPDTSNNLLAFEWDGKTYSTGVSDNVLTTRGVTYIAQKFRALKIQTLGFTTSTYFLQGSKIDGSNAITKLEPPLIGTTATGAELAARLTDGVNGLALGTGIANIKAGTAEFKIGTNNLNLTGIGDGKPDLIVTQVAEPGGGTPDKFKFVDASGATVGNELTVNFDAVNPVGTYNLDLFRADNGAVAFVPADQRDIRLLGIETSSFGINSGNSSLVDRFVVTFSGNSDCAFIAFNTESLKIAELSLVKTASITNSCGKAGDVITYNFDIKNTGEVPITNISISDPMVGLNIPGNSIASLAAGSTATLTGTYVITSTDVNLGKVVNSAKVTGTDPSLNIVEDISGHSYTDNIATEIILLTPPTLGAITNVSCSGLGKIVLSNLPSGSWTLERTPGGVSTPGSGTTATIDNIPVGSSYSFKVRTPAGCKSPSSATFNITNQSATTWDGISWSHGLPDNTKKVIFSSPYTISSDLAACELTINSGVNLIVPSGITLNVLNAVSVSSTGSLTFENNSSLVQTNNATNVGNIIYRRITKPIRRYDYTYWSSPIYDINYTLNTLSSATLGDKYLYYDPTDGWKINGHGTKTMVPGEGYAVRAPQTYNIVVASTYLASFIGVPNNGNFTINPQAAKWYLLGNPYPSAISADAFIGANSNAGALYFWTHNSPPSDAVSGDAKYNYTSNDYAVYTLAGGTGTTVGADRPNGYIATAQGFFIQASTADPIVFTNTMRRSSNNTQFFKTAVDNSENKNRIWLNLTNNGGAFKQILLGYMDGATNSIDTNYDAETMSGNSYIDFYTISDAKKLTIQARSIPFDDTEIIPLGYKTSIAGDFKISIDEADGLFKNQKVYLEDKTTGTITDLQTSNYTFTTKIGTFTDRFTLRYTSKTLGTDEFENLEDNILITVKDKAVKINSSTENIKDVVIYNISGQEIFNKKKVNAHELLITNLQASPQVLLIKIILENGYTTTKKIVYH